MEKKEIDIWRDTPVRLLGYANECGESFRFIYPRLVIPSYMVAIGYTFCDCFDKGHKAYKLEGKKVTKNVAITSFDALLWQLLASVAIPGFIINRLVHSTEYFVKVKFPAGGKIGPVPIRFIPTIIGLGCIPFIVEPIDHFVDLSMDKTVRKLY